MAGNIRNIAMAAIFKYVYAGAAPSIDTKMIKLIGQKFHPIIMTRSGGAGNKKCESKTKDINQK